MDGAPINREINSAGIVMDHITHSLSSTFYLLGYVIWLHVLARSYYVSAESGTISNMTIIMTRLFVSFFAIKV